ncbi:MAG: VTT domain-containing protein [Patescibacteria group bacterium]
MFDDLPSLIRTAGYLGIAGILFAESGILIGLFLPGDSLLFTAGILASQGYLHIGILCFVGWIAAIAGDSVGYAFGQHVGPRIFTRDDSRFWNKQHIEHARAFYTKYGAKTILLARFVPIVRTFAPVLAGVGHMRYRTFLLYNLIGGALWAVGLPLLGYFLGNAIPDVDRYLLPLIAGIVLLSVMPAVIPMIRSWFRNRTHTL